MSIRWRDWHWENVSKVRPTQERNIEEGKEHIQKVIWSISMIETIKIAES